MPKTSASQATKRKASARKNRAIAVRWAAKSKMSSSAAKYEKEATRSSGKRIQREADSQDSEKVASSHAVTRRCRTSAVNAAERRVRRFPEKNERAVL